jgi:hypothetical protein
MHQHSIQEIGKIADPIEITSNQVVSKHSLSSYQVLLKAGNALILSLQVQI